MIKNYYKQSRLQPNISTQKHSCEFHCTQKYKSKSTTPNKLKVQQKQSKQNLKQKFRIPKGEQKYFQECFPEEYAIFSINNEIYFEKDIIKCKQKDSQLNTTLEGSSDEDPTQLQDFTLQASFNPLHYTQHQHSSRFLYSNRERIFEEGRNSLSPMQRSLYFRNNSQLQSSKRKIFD